MMESSLAQQSIPAEVQRPVSCDRVPLMRSLAPARAIPPGQKLLDALAGPAEAAAPGDAVASGPTSIELPGGPGEAGSEVFTDLPPGLPPGGPGTGVIFPGGPGGGGPGGGGPGGGGTGGGSAAPEPGAWALLLGGFGLVGAALRARRRRTSSVVNFD